jgi:integrase
MMNNVVQFNREGDKNVYACVKTMLDRMAQNSDNTAETYERAIRSFFLTMRNKEVKHLVEADLIFTKPQIETYQVSLRNKYKASTVNNRMSAIKKCYEKFEDYGFDVKSSWFNVERYDEFDKEPYDPMTHEEILQAINLVSDTRKGFEKALLIKVAYATAFRKESILGLKWSDLTHSNGTWFLKTLGKGNKWDYKKVSNGLYEDLMHQKELIGGEKIFQLTKKTVKRMLDFLRSNIDFGDRNIAFHSLKKSSIEEVAIITNYDLKAMQAQGNHASVKTTLDNYMSQKALDDLVIVDVDRHIPTEKFEDLSKEEMIELFNSKLDRNTQIKILQAMGAM